MGATKKEELENPKSCWNKADDDEPVFVLLGRDLCASGAIDGWVRTAQTMGLHGEKLEEAREWAKLALRYRRQRRTESK